MVNNTLLNAFQVQAFADVEGTVPTVPSLVPTFAQCAALWCGPHVAHITSERPIDTTTPPRAIDRLPNDSHGLPPDAGFVISHEDLVEGIFGGGVS